MRYTTTESNAAVVLTPAGLPATSSVIWLHGLGADGYDFVPLVPELHLPDRLAIRFIFPHAPVRPVTVNNGMSMRAWYDIKEFSVQGREDDAGTRQSAESIESLIAQERRSGIDARHIVIAGFSQGGAVALHVALRHKERLGGLLALSTYLPLRASLATEASAANRDLPILMCHGVDDPVLPLQFGESSRDLLEAAGYRVEWKTYAMPHAVCPEEIADISAWLGGVLA